MRNENVAILDVRSYEVTFFLGSKGVNDTFMFSGSHTEKYDGFSKDGFLSVESFRRAVVSAVTMVRQNFEGVIGEIYVGVPSAFLSVATKGHTLSFPKKRKLSAQDVDALYESGLNGLLANGVCVRRSDMYFTLGDNRKYFEAKDIYGVPTTLLQGALCYYFVEDGFYDLVKGLLNDLDFENVYFLPTNLAQSLYLLPAKKREGYAFLLDIGFLTTSISVVYGNGVVREETFNGGIASILVSLMERFNVDYDLAEEILLSANVSGGGVPKALTWTSERGENAFSVQAINDTIKFALDELCEHVENFFEKHYKEKYATVFAVNPISVTGEGVGKIAGVAEHISKRLNRLTEVVVPDLPYYDKPDYSSKIALLNMATIDGKKRGVFQRLFKLGGNK